MDATHPLLVMTKRWEFLLYTCNVTHFLLAIRCDETVFQKNVQLSHPPSVGHRIRHSEPTAFRKIYGVTHYVLVMQEVRFLLKKIGNVTHKLVVIGQADVMRLPIRKMWNVTYCLLVNEQDMTWMKLPFRKGCHLQPVGHRARCNEIAVQTLVQCHSHTVSHDMVKCEIVFHENLKHHSHSERHTSVTRLPRRTQNITYLLLAMGQDVMRLYFRDMSNITHLLLVMGAIWWDSLVEVNITLTSCQSWEEIWSASRMWLHAAACCLKFHFMRGIWNNRWPKTISLTYCWPSMMQYHQSQTFVLNTIFVADILC